MRLPARLTLSCLLLVACTKGPASAAPLAGAPTNPDGERPRSHVVTGHTARRDLVENSGAAMSATQAGVFFTINDSGNDPVLYATDSSGADRGAWRVTGAANLDWESIAIGPCGAASGGAGDVASGPPRCVYIGDTGDNDGRYSARTIYRIVEPVALAASGAGRFGATTPIERLGYVYADGPRDVEAMTVGPTGEITLYTKRPLRGADGRLRPSLLYRIPATAWSVGRHATATLADSLPAIVPGAGPGGSLVTDAALASDARHVAVRTYTTVYVYASDPATGRISAGAAPAICDVSAFGGDAGEGITWLPDGRLVLTSEGEGSAVDVVRCAMPSGAR